MRKLIKARNNKFFYLALKKKHELLSIEEISVRHMRSVNKSISRFLNTFFFWREPIRLINK